MTKKAKRTERKKSKIFHISRSSLGIDVSKSTIHCTLVVQDVNFRRKVLFSKKFANTLKGFEELNERITKSLGEGNRPDIVVMEATGVYYENVAYYLYKNGFTVVVELPQRIKSFAQSIGTKTKTDKVDSKVIAFYGLSNSMEDLTVWRPVSKKYSEMKSLLRYRIKIKKRLTQLKNRLHALNHSYQPSKDVIRLIKREIKFQEIILEIVEKKIEKLVKQDRELSRKIAKIETIKSVGFWTAVTVVIEYNGFILAKNRNQVVSFAGLDVVENQSGQHQGKSKISKQGNKFVRSVLYMSSLSAFRYNPVLKDFYDRLIDKGKNKAQARSAVVRKTLIYIYTIWKTDKSFDPNYAKNQMQQRSVDISAAA